MKKLVAWLDGSFSNTWAPKRLAEGVIRLENDMELMPPKLDEISWDGIEEKVEVGIPAAKWPGSRFVGNNGTNQHTFGMLQQSRQSYSLRTLSSNRVP